MTESVTYVRIVGEPFLSRAREYREKRIAWHRAWGEFAKTKGATGFGGMGRHLCFGRAAPPDGWVRPKGSDHMSRPKKGHADVAEMDRMRADHPRPDAWDIFACAVLRTLEWIDEDGRTLKGSLGSIGTILEGPSVGWAGETFIALIPDAEAAAREMAKQSPPRTVVGEAATWMLPEGLVRITEAEKELIYAEHRVAEERAKAAA